MQALPVADELFLIGHDEYSGKPLIDDIVLDTGLAGAVLAELVLAGRVGIGAGGIVRVQDDRAHGDTVTDAAVAELLRQDEERPVRPWLEHLRRQVRIMVAPRLTEPGLVEHVRPLRLLGLASRYRAVSPLAANAPRVRVRHMIDQPDQLDAPTTLLGALAGAVGLAGVLGIGAPGPARRRLDGWAARLPPDLGLVCAGVAAAVAAVALTA